MSQRYFCFTLKPLRANHKSSPTHGCEERMGAQRGSKVASTVAAVVNKKGTSWDKATLISEEIKFLTQAVLELCL